MAPARKEYTGGHSRIDGQMLEKDSKVSNKETCLHDTNAGSRSTATGQAQKLHGTNSLLSCRELDPKFCQNKMLPVKSKVLCLGVSYACTKSQIRDELGPDVKLIYNETSVEQAIELVRRNVLTEMDGRDLARCLALESLGDTHAYTVSMETGASYHWRHLTANFNRKTFSQEVKKAWGNGIKFRQIILDYFWIPRGCWVMTHWTRSFFNFVLPSFVSDGLMDFSYGPTMGGSEDQLSTLNRRGGVVYLPFCLHCVKEVIASINVLSRFYKITFLPKAKLSEHALWAATSSIDADAMQSWLGKAINQEDIYCTFGPSEVCNSGDDAFVLKRDILKVLRGIEDFEEIRMIKLEALRKYDPSYTKCCLHSVTPESGFEQSDLLPLRVSLKNENTRIEKGGFVGLIKPKFVVRGFDYIRQNNKKVSGAKIRRKDVNQFANDRLQIPPAVQEKNNPLSQSSSVKRLIGKAKVGTKLKTKKLLLKSVKSKSREGGLYILAKQRYRSRGTSKTDNDAVAVTPLVMFDDATIEATLIVGGSTLVSDPSEASDSELTIARTDANDSREQKSDEILPCAETGLDQCPVATPVEKCCAVPCDGVSVDGYELIEKCQSLSIDLAKAGRHAATNRDETLAISEITLMLDPTKASDADLAITLSDTNDFCAETNDGETSGCSGAGLDQCLVTTAGEKCLALPNNDYAADSDIESKICPAVSVIETKTRNKFDTSSDEISMFREPTLVSDPSEASDSELTIARTDANDSREQKSDEILPCAGTGLDQCPVATPVEKCCAVPSDDVSVDDNKQTVGCQLVQAEAVPNKHEGFKPATTKVTRFVGQGKECLVRTLDKTTIANKRLPMKRLLKDEKRPERLVQTEAVSYNDGDFKLTKVNINSSMGHGKVCLVGSSRANKRLVNNRSRWILPPRKHEKNGKRRMRLRELPELKVHSRERKSESKASEDVAESFLIPDINTRIKKFGANLSDVSRISSCLAPMTENLNKRSDLGRSTFSSKDDTCHNCVVCKNTFEGVMLTSKPIEATLEDACIPNVRDFDADETIGCRGSTELIRKPTPVVPVCTDVSAGAMQIRSHCSYLTTEYDVGVVGLSQTFQNIQISCTDSTTQSTEAIDDLELLDSKGLCAEVQLPKLATSLLCKHRSPIYRSFEKDVLPGDQQCVAEADSGAIANNSGILQAARRQHSNAVCCDAKADQRSFEETFACENKDDSSTSRQFLYDRKYDTDVVSCQDNNDHNYCSMLGTTGKALGNSKQCLLLENARDAQDVVFSHTVTPNEVWKSKHSVDLCTDNRANESIWYPPQSPHNLDEDKVIPTLMNDVQDAANTLCHMKHWKSFTSKDKSRNTFTKDEQVRLNTPLLSASVDNTVNQTLQQFATAPNVSFDGFSSCNKTNCDNGHKRVKTKGLQHGICAHKQPSISESAKEEAKNANHRSRFEKDKSDASIRVVCEQSCLCECAMKGQCVGCRSIHKTPNLKGCLKDSCMAQISVVSDQFFGTNAQKPTRKRRRKSVKSGAEPISIKRRKSSTQHATKKSSDLFEAEKMVSQKKTEGNFVRSRKVNTVVARRSPSSVVSPHKKSDCSVPSVCFGVERTKKNGNDPNVRCLSRGPSKASLSATSLSDPYFGTKGKANDLLGLTSFQESRREEALTTPNHWDGYENWKVRETKCFERFALDNSLTQHSRQKTLEATARKTTSSYAGQMLGHMAPDLRTSMVVQNGYYTCNTFMQPHDRCFYYNGYAGSYVGHDFVYRADAYVIRNVHERDDGQWIGTAYWNA